MSSRGRSIVTVAALIARIQTMEMPFHFALALDNGAMPLNEVAEAQRATQVSNNFGQVSPGLVQNTTDLLFRDLWLRPALAPRDRSLVTVSALIASGQVAQITYHLNRAMDNGLTQPQASEVVTHIAFYAGWPNAFSALPVVKEIFEKRQK
jgi:4-carboxymuconolactone decarboxylase